MDEILLKNATLVIGAIFTAMVAGFFAFMNLVSSKEQKVSEFRQEWIDSLRNSISVYISSLSYLSILYKHRNDEGVDKTSTLLEFTKSVNDVYLKLNESYNDILFRINPSEKNKKTIAVNDDFLKALEETRRLYMTADFFGAVKACDELRHKTKPLLKYEWIRVKTGEPSFRFWKGFSIFILLCGFSLSLFSGYSLYDKVSQVPQKSEQSE
ncbi:hypothetical protein GLP37_17415 [Photobacterium phosphoreum]|uniref:hypothetical protein n=1 Tax=Photobacterium phosphoreum TaxID=659 RepID=UPI001E38C478|nr:hypothetical protein [Photobacterium phosphoreum]MCD9503950.1 hypothetical protein [Photobacterium phosphoreum]